MQKETVLTHLMNVQQITASQLAERSGLDPELLDALYQQKLQVSDTLLHEIAHHLYAASDPEQVCAVLERLIPESSSQDAAIQEELLYSVLDWILEPGSPAAEEAAPEASAAPESEPPEVSGLPAEPPVQIYLPQCSETIPAALQAFWERVAATAPAAEILLTDWGAYALDRMPEEVFAYLQQQLFLAVQRGSSVRILTKAMQSYPEPAVIARRLPLYCNSGITFYQMPLGMTCPNCESFLVAGTQTVLLTRLIPGSQPISTILQEPTLTQYYHQWMRLMMHQRRPVTEHLQACSLSALYARLLADAYPMTTLYLIESVPSFVQMPPDLLDEILLQNHASDDERSLCHDMRQAYAALPKKCRCVQCYNVDAILQAIGQDTLQDPLLSGILHRPASFHRQQLLRQLQYLRRNTERPGYHLLLPSFAEDFHCADFSVLLAVQEDSMVAVVNPSQCSQNFYSRELSCVGGCSRYAEQLLHAMPPMKQNPQRTRRLLERCIALLENSSEKA